MGFCFDFQGKVFGPVDNGAPLFCIAGPCALEVATALWEIFAAAGVSFIYKSSFDKANRSSGSSFRGVGMAQGLSILAAVQESVGVPVLTDVHTPEQAAPVAEVADMLQTPAFLCCGRCAHGRRAVLRAGRRMSETLSCPRWSGRQAAATGRNTGGPCSPDGTARPCAGGSRIWALPRRCWGRWTNGRHCPASWSVAASWLRKSPLFGDDIPDMEVFGLCGVSVTVADAPKYVKARADLVLECGGGLGAFRELADRIKEI